MRRWHPGLRTSIVLSVIAITVAATGTMAYLSYQLQQSEIRNRFAAAAKANFDSDAQGVHQWLVNTAGGGSKVDSAGVYLKGRLALDWAIVNFNPATGPISRQEGAGYVAVAGVPVVLDAEQVDRARKQLETVVFNDVVQGSTQLIFVKQTEPDMLLVEFYSTAITDHELARVRLELSAASLLVILVGSGLGLLAARRIQRRVRVAAGAARQLGSGDLETRLPVQGQDEFADLAGEFNAMARRLGESIEELRRKDEQQRQFVADVAHDLRTPMAVLIAASDGLAGPDHDRSAELIASQSRRLSALVEDLLEMSRFDAGAAEFRPEPVDLQELCVDVVEMVAADIPVRLLGEGVLVGDPRRLHTIVRNLVSNALHHGAPPITITIDGADPSEVRVAVRDHGPGLPPELMPVVFDRFVRGDRSRRGEGSGLGLAIAYENAVLHGGRIDVASPGGAEFTLVVPRIPRGGRPPIDESPEPAHP
ncbi:HAMP domain-containing sensor histidine kinase [Kutzneria sp. 744]|uniref:sensor histidine kinase n=1 Tax=Kutzneria sp. (strain 744) TaxID=345341 RepID=UPI0003EECDAC|nr:HAMP domain-containing sensor histidine kinase [Kutzneria sp. 744]EWM13283.1 sensor histidine kinase MtrB [Kutzneria sp. 744]